MGGWMHILCFMLKYFTHTHFKKWFLVPTNFLYLLTSYDLSCDNEEGVRMVRNGNIPQTQSQLRVQKRNKGRLEQVSSYPTTSLPVLPQLSNSFPLCVLELVLSRWFQRILSLKKPLDMMPALTNKINTKETSIHWTYVIHQTVLWAL